MKANRVEYSFCIMKYVGDTKHLLTQSDEVFEEEDEFMMANMVEVLNQNSDSGCKYELIKIPKRNNGQ